MILERTHLRRAGVLLICAYALLQVMNVLPPRLLGWGVVVVLGIGVIYSLWRKPGYAVGVLAAYAAARGGEAILTVAPAAVILGAWSVRRRAGRRLGLRGAAITAAAAVGALLATLPFVDLAIGPTDPESAAASGTAGARSVSSRPGESLFARFVGWVQPPPEDRNWWLIAAVAVAALLGAYLGLRWWHRRRNRTEVVPAPALARLEALGRTLGRRRSPNEGAISYAAALGDHAGDDRVIGAGPLVSGQVYQSRSVDPATVEQSLLAVEREPPPRPPRRRLRRAGARLVALAEAAVARPRFLLRVGGAAVGLVLLVWAAWPHLARLDVAEPAAAETPQLWDELAVGPAGELERWQACGLTRTGETSFGVASTGVSHLTSARAASRQVVSYDGETASTIHRLTDGQRGFIDYGSGDWAEIDLVPTPHQPFESIHELLGLLGLESSGGVTLTDRIGERFVRYESLAMDGSAFWAPGDDLSLLGSPVTDQVWALDVWLDGEAIVRVRLITAEPTLRWYEWRRTPVDGGADRMAPPTCPADPEAPEPGSGWRGLPSWSPSLQMPLQVTVDDAGNPYDSTYDVPTASWHPAGTFTTDDGPLTFLDPYDLVAGNEADRSYRFDPGPGLTLEAWSAQAEGGGVGFRLDLDGEAQVDRWQLSDEIDFYGSLLGVVSGELPVVSQAQLDAALEAGWSSGKNSFEVDLDDSPGPDLAVMVTWVEDVDVVEGLDHSGRVVSIVVYDTWLPWRALGLDGQAPATVLEREAQLRECIAGTRPVEGDGTCSRD